MTQADEGRTLSNYERIYHNQARRYDIPGLDHEDKVQLARIAALEALRKFDPSRPRDNLAGWITNAVKFRLRRERWRHHNPKHANLYAEARLFSLDDPLTVTSKVGDTWDGMAVDNVPSADTADRNLLLMACESLCHSGVERAIIDAVASGREMKEVAASLGMWPQSLNKMKQRLMTRLKKELFA